MMEDVRIIGASKIDTALEHMRAMLLDHETGDGKSKINDVAIIVDLTEQVPGKDYNGGFLLYSCSDERGWIQEAFFLRAANAVASGAGVPAEDEQ